MISNTRKLIESQLLSYIGYPIIPVLSQDDRAVRSAFLMGLSDFWINCPYERPHSISVPNALVKVSAAETLAQDIPEKAINNAYIIGITYLQFNPVSSILGQSPYGTTVGASTLDYMVMGTSSKNIGVSMSGRNNIMRGYGTGNVANPFVDVARGSISGNILRKSAYDALTRWTGINGSVEYQYNKLDDTFEFNIPVTTSGILKYNVGYGFLPEDPELDENGNIIDKESYEIDLDKVLDITGNEYQELIEKYVALHFLEIIIAARGSCNFGGADYTLDVGRMESIKSKIEQELKTMSVEYGYRLMSWQ